MKASKSRGLAVVLVSLALSFSPIVDARVGPRDPKAAGYADEILYAFKSKNEAEIMRLVGVMPLSIINSSSSDGPALFLTPFEFAELVSLCEEAEAKTIVPDEAMLIWTCPKQTIGDAGCYYPSYLLHVRRKRTQILSFVSQSSHLKLGMTKAQCKDDRPSLPPPPVYLPVDTSPLKFRGRNND